MFKTIAFACAAVALASAQNLQDVANQASAAASSDSLSSIASQANAQLGPLLNQENPVVQNGNSLSLNVNDYEWTLTEVDGEYNLNVEQTAANANNLAPALSALLASAAANNGAVENLLDAEAAGAGVDIEGTGALASQLSENSGAITQLAEQQYQDAAAALASNSNGIADQVNSQINEAVNNQEGLSAAVNNAVSSALNNAGAVESLAAANVGNLPVSVNGDTSALQQAALGAAGNAAGNANGAAASASDLANQALSSGSAAANNLSGGLASGVQSAANNAASSAQSAASSSASSAQNSLDSAVGAGNVQAAANLVNGQ